MCQSDCFKRSFQPRKKKTQPYSLTNAFSTPLACQQIITLIMFILQLILHSIFIVPVLDDIKHAVLWVMLAFHYVMLIAIAIDYIYLSVTDPVDPMVLNQDLANNYRIQQLCFCGICDKNVHINSHHCYRCNRCTSDFDHHCKFLNNCIGGQNYESFFRLLCIYTLYNVNIIAQCIWVFVRNHNDQNIAFGGNKWGVLALLILTFVLFSMVGALLVFHCYLSTCGNTTTLDFNYPQRKDNIEPKAENPKININIFEPPTSAQRIGQPVRV